MHVPSSNLEKLGWLLQDFGVAAAPQGVAKGRWATFWCGSISLILLALPLLLCTASTFAAERGKPADVTKGPRWYQVEVVVFRQPLSSSLQENLLHPEPLALPDDMIALLPREGEPIRPWLMSQLRSGWLTNAYAPRLRVLHGDLTPELEDLIDYLEIINLRAANFETFAMLREVTSTSVENLVGSEEPRPPPRPSREPIDIPAPPQALMTQAEVDAALAVAPETAIEAAYRSLPPEEHVLAKEAASLARRAGYRVLAHQAWLEPMQQKVPPTHVMIVAGNDDRDIPGRIIGTVGIRLSRFLHAEVVFSFPYGNTGGYAHLVETRRMRSQEVHYIDHPLFGALIRIEPYPHPAPEVE